MRKCQKMWEKLVLAIWHQSEVRNQQKTKKTNWISSLVFLYFFSKSPTNLMLAFWWMKALNDSGTFRMFGTFCFVCLFVCLLIGLLYLFVYCFLRLYVFYIFLRASLLLLQCAALMLDPQPIKMQPTNLSFLEQNKGQSTRLEKARLWYKIF